MRLKQIDMNTIKSKRDFDSLSIGTVVKVSTALGLFGEQFSGDYEFSGYATVDVGSEVVDTIVLLDNDNDKVILAIHF